MGGLAYFVDRSLGGRLLVGALRDAGHDVHAHAEHFAHDTPDEVWLNDVGRRGWVVLSRTR